FPRSKRNRGGYFHSSGELCGYSQSDCKIFLKSFFLSRIRHTLTVRSLPWALTGDRTKPLGRTTRCGAGSGLALLRRAWGSGRCLATSCNGGSQQEFLVFPIVIGSVFALSLFL